MNNPIKAWRQRHGWSQEDVAKLIGYTQTVVSDWERDKRRPGPTACMALERASEGELRCSELRPDIFPAGFRAA